MAFLPLRGLPPAGNSRIADAWLERLDDRLSSASNDVAADRSLLCRETLAELCYPQYAANWETAVADESLPLGTRLSAAGNCSSAGGLTMLPT